MELHCEALVIQSTVTMQRCSCYFVTAPKSLLFNVLRMMTRYQCYKVDEGWLSPLVHGLVRSASYNGHVNGERAKHEPSRMTG